MGRRVLFSDLELFLTGYLRAELAALGTPLASDVFVSNSFPSPARPKAVVIRDDSGPSASVITKEPTIGVTVLAGDDQTNGKAATDLANIVHMLLSDCAGTQPGNPVAAVLGSNGPYKVTEESGQPRRYMTFELSVTGQAFPS